MQDTFQSRVLLDSLQCVKELQRNNGGTTYAVNTFQHANAQYQATLVDQVNSDSLFWGHLFPGFCELLWSRALLGVKTLIRSVVGVLQECLETKT
jgi:hypothetical protein